MKKYAVIIAIINIVLLDCAQKKQDAHKNTIEQKIKMEAAHLQALDQARQRIDTLRASDLSEFNLIVEGYRHFKRTKMLSKELIAHLHLQVGALSLPAQTISKSWDNALGDYVKKVDAEMAFQRSQALAKLKEMELPSARLPKRLMRQQRRLSVVELLHVSFAQGASIAIASGSASSAAAAQAVIKEKEVKAKEDFSSTRPRSRTEYDECESVEQVVVDELFIPDAQGNAPTDTYTQSIAGDDAQPQKPVVQQIQKPKPARWSVGGHRKRAASEALLFAASKLHNNLSKK